MKWQIFTGFSWGRKESKMLVCVLLKASEGQEGKNFGLAPVSMYMACFSG